MISLKEIIMFCPDCGNEINENDKCCPNCGYIKNENENKEFSFNIAGVFSVLFFIFILSAVVYLYLAKVGSSINLDDSNIPEIMLKPDSCSSIYVESEVISLFKQSDLYFNDIEYKTIDSIRLQSKETVSDDKKSAKYICSGVVEIKSSPKGFRPSAYNKNNSFYKKIYIDYDDSLIAKYTSYEVPIFYTSQIIDDKNLVEISEFGLGEFDCKGICTPIRRYLKPTSVKTAIPSIKQINQQELQTPINKENIVNIQENQKKTENKKQDESKIKKEKKFEKFKIFKRKKREKI